MNWIFVIQRVFLSPSNQSYDILSGMLPQKHLLQFFLVFAVLHMIGGQTMTSLSQTSTEIWKQLIIFFIPTAWWRWQLQSIAKENAAILTFFMCESKNIYMSLSQVLTEYFVQMFVFSFFVKLDKNLVANQMQLKNNCIYEGQ